MHVISLSHLLIGNSNRIALAIRADSDNVDPAIVNDILSRAQLHLAMNPRKLVSLPVIQPVQIKRARHMMTPRIGMRTK